MRKILWTSLCLVALATPSFASGIELTPHIGYRWNGTIDADLSDVLRSDVDVEDSESFGVTLGIPLSSGFQLELLASRQESQLEVDGGLFEDPRTLGDITVDYYHAGLLWQWGAGQAVPFFTISGGVTRLDPEWLGADSETRPSLSLGGGVKIFVTDNLGFRFEGRGFFTDLEEDDDDDRCCRYDDEEDDLTQGEVRTGLIVRF
jgi:opacity protein-like surface antigen